jgi:hypothetical protein
MPASTVVTFLRRREGHSPHPRRFGREEDVTAKTLLMALGVGLVVGVLLGIGLLELIGGKQEQAAPTAPPRAANGATLEAVFIHHATPENTSANSTYLDTPLTDGNPNAVLMVTHNWNPGGGSGKYNDHPIGVWYYPDRGKWAIFNQDRAAMPVGADFNVAVLKEPTEAR